MLLRLKLIRNRSVDSLLRTTELTFFKGSVVLDIYGVKVCRSGHIAFPFAFDFLRLEQRILPLTRITYFVYKDIVFLKPVSALEKLFLVIFRSQMGKYSWRFVVNQRFYILDVIYVFRVVSLVGENVDEILGVRIQILSTSHNFQI